MIQIRPVIVREMNSVHDKCAWETIANSTLLIRVVEHQVLRSVGAHVADLRHDRDETAVTRTSPVEV